MYRTGNVPWNQRLTALLLLSSLTTPVALAAATEPLENGRPPIDTDAALRAIRQADFAEPIYVESREDNNQVQGGIYVLIDTPFKTLREKLADKRSWCEIIFLHFNIKACVLDMKSDPTRVSIYSGRLYYQSPEEATRNDYVFEAFSFRDNYLNTVLHGPDGPFGTRDYRIVIQAVPVDEHTTLAHVSYSLHYNMVTRVAQRVYFASAGRHRIGFSREGTDNTPVRGVRGMVERNTMRFYLALEAFLGAPEPNQRDERLERWHTLTLQYPDQLKELDLETYLDYKSKERAHQDNLQKNADRGEG
ncbi:hypothetical protein [Isoalcanivorax indicus]|uniref:hypothetical protein n=1 Tax=Isoalcanivorax indicus TaxID=2202653 RepID=UPI000DB90BAD|nr:hypothetical protein [Isoalcanivorax indicus]